MTLICYNYVTEYTSSFFSYVPLCLLHSIKCLQCFSDVDQKEEDDSKESGVQYSGKVEDEAWLKFISLDQNQTDCQIYNGLIRGMNVFHWQSA